MAGGQVEPKKYLGLFSGLRVSNQYVCESFTISSHISNKASSAIFFAALWV